MWAKISTFFLNFIWNKAITALSLFAHILYDAYKYNKLKKEREEAQKKAKDKLDQVMNNPESSIEDRSDAYEDFVNSGRK